jgi:diguanylate cyclase (GGDEF)-like protein
MRLNTKIGLILGAPMLLLLAVLGAVLHAVVVSRFAALEQRELVQNHERMLQALESEFEELERLAVDWAVWDDTYRFMHGENPDWLLVNFTPLTFDNLQLAGLLIFDTGHRLHTDYTYLVAEQRFVQQSPRLLEAIGALIAARSATPADEAKAHGILAFEGRVLQLGISPIHDSNGEGEPLGTLIMMRSIDANRVERLAQRIRLTLRFYPLGDALDDPQAARAAAALTEDGLHIAETGAEQISAFSVLDDLNGQPTLLMQVGMPREILQQGREAVLHLLAFSFGALLLLGFGMFIAIRQVALKRLSRIGRTLVSIGSGDATQARLPVAGNDEIDRLARSINAMLDGLDHAYSARRQTAERQRELNALLVRIATDDGLAQGDEEALFRVLTGSLGQGARLDRWSLWLKTADDPLPTCWRVSGGNARQPPPEAAVIDRELTAWSGVDGSVLRLGGRELGPGRHALLLPFAAEQWRGALVIETLHGSADWPEDEINFLVSATSLVERSLAAHFAHQREELLRQQAEIDPLTGLANRAMFERALRRALIRCRDEGGMLAVLFLDLDGFKPVNDQHGHAVGDRILREVAERLRDQLRSYDMVARLGGDEFTVILDKLRSESGASRIAGKLIDSINRPFIRGDLELHIGVSIGIACAPAHGLDFDALMHAADMAMYAAKQAGRNTWRVHEA